MFVNLPSILTIIQTLAIVISLLVVAWQTKELVKQTRLNTITGLSIHLKEINELLLQDEELGQLLGEKKEESFADLLFSEFYLWFILHKEGLIDQAWWRAYDSTITETLRREFMFHRFEKMRSQYHPKFMQFIDEKLPKRVHEGQIPPEVSQRQ